jgi:hypothetical protein
LNAKKFHNGKCSNDSYFNQIKSFLISFSGSSHHSENRLHLAGSGSGSESASDGRASSVANRQQQQQQHIVNRQHSNQALNRDGIGDLLLFNLRTSF